HHHPRHRASLPLPSVLPPPRRSRCQPGLLEHQPCPGVRQLQLVLLRRELVKVLYREVRVLLPPQSEQLADRLHWYPLSARPPTSPIAKPSESDLLVPSP